ncbi:hypothetical protein IVA96_07200 [Bradyrhizobium sp. 159]|uniref:hypothetical protein n=1 Tax=Bradyrhizobium sp. 159 TaxID=2782632 RepID=UPI001FF986BE|nr:hypothetical protein [Bradyrhizobium sp. 159]MCK1616444.1 hypothetical protein [Bradyrhizobium sp. 159]
MVLPRDTKIDRDIPIPRRPILPDLHGATFLASDHSSTIPVAAAELVRRQMYGRGKIDLLQARLIGAE